jgi:leader peptidase (prepilin peptidase)/N-methyltransferase
MWAAVGAVVVVSCVVAVESSRILRLLPVPEGGASYASAATARFAIGAASLCAAAGLCAVGALSWPMWLPWIGFAGLGVWLACVDAVTGIVPRRVSHLAAAVIMILVTAQAAVEGSAAPLVRAVVGGTGVWLLFAGLWLVARGAFGFGDVRYSLPWAMTAAAASWQHLGAAALLGSVLALLYGLTAGALRGARSFPYTPGLAAGLFAAAPLLAMQ